MPAGDQITAFYQVELNGLLTGAGTDYEIGPAGIRGLGVPPAKTQNVQLDGQDGEYGGPYYMGARTLLVAYELCETTDAQVLDITLELIAAWEPTLVDVELHLSLPNWGHGVLVGKPNNLDLDLTLVRAGVITGVGQFDGLTPRFGPYVP